MQTLTAAEKLSECRALNFVDPCSSSDDGKLWDTRSQGEDVDMDADPGPSQVSFIHVVAYVHV